MNGAYRMVEMLAIIAYELDSFGTYSSMIRDVLDDYDSGNRSASSAPQQLVNGLYRCVELLAVIATENS